MMESSASLDREITNPKELRNLDEFLGNQVQRQDFVKKLLFIFTCGLGLKSKSESG